MNTNYDVMILGTGEAGIYAAYELALKCPSARVLVVDKGADIYRPPCWRRFSMPSTCRYPSCCCGMWAQP